LCIRKVATTIRNSIYQLLIDKLLEYDIYSEFTINKSEMRFTHTLTGNEILCAGMDNPEKIKSIAGITSVWCEEATELDELDFNQLELRVRGETANYKQFIITFNPISEQHWIKRRFFDDPNDETYLLHTTYRDNAFLDADYIHHLQERVKANPNLHKVYVLGEWGKVDFGGEFLKSWSTVKHVQQLRL
jgi:phage terminase large subunit